jgi:hypothetical protein
MTTSATAVKISSFVDTTLLPELKGLYEKLKAGDLLTFEQGLVQTLQGLQNVISEELLQGCSSELAATLKEKAYKEGCRKLVLRPVQFRLQTGYVVELENYYVKELPESGCWQGSRHTIERYWCILGRSSPEHYNQVGFCAMLSPSYSVAQQTLDKFGVDQSISSVRKITNTLAAHCRDKEVQWSTQEADDLSGKRVVIGIDGGRTRTRCYDGFINEAGNATYETPWREPKLFTIGILDEAGNLEKEYDPIYGCRFGETDSIELLGQYLKHLHVEQAALVQLVADGAPWIWLRVKAMLLGLEVEEGRIVETLDYCHAASYVYKLVEALPKRIDQPERRKHVEQFKEWLWHGQSNQIVQSCQSLFKRPSTEVNRWINFLDKHQHRTNYAQFFHDKLMCGSGIIESGIRRIINLRFKNPSTFWNVEVVENLYFLRAALLSKRWDLLISNIVIQT